MAPPASNRTCKLLNHNPCVGKVVAMRTGMHALPSDRGHPMHHLDVLRHLGGVGRGVAALGTLLLRHRNCYWNHLTLDLCRWTQIMINSN